MSNESTHSDGDEIAARIAAKAKALREILSHTDKAELDAKLKAFGDAEIAESDAKMKAIEAKIKAHYDSVDQSKKTWETGISFQLARPLQRLLSWLALGLIGLLASSLTAFVLIGVFSGKIQAFSKYGKGSQVLFSLNPVAFWVEIAIQLIIAFAFCWMFKLIWKATSGFR